MLRMLGSRGLVESVVVAQASPKSRAGRRQAEVPPALDELDEIATVEDMDGLFIGLGAIVDPARRSTPSISFSHSTAFSKCIIPRSAGD
jgi:hypothetical protein